MIVGEYYLQYLYSFLLCVCILFMVAACAPIGFITLFDAAGHLLVKPYLFENNDEKIATAQLEEVRGTFKSFYGVFRSLSSLWPCR